MGFSSAPVQLYRSTCQENELQLMKIANDGETGFAIRYIS